MAKYVNKGILASKLAEELNMKRRDANEAVNLIFDEMAQALENDGTVEISGFGKFYIFDRKSRMGINPITKEKMMIPASKLPKYKPSQTLKKRCNKDREKF